MEFYESNSRQHENCQVIPLDKPASPQQLAEAETAFFLVSGMGCPTCAMRVHNGLLQIEGVVAADVILNRHLAKVWYDPQVLQPEVLAARLPAVTADGRHHYTAHLLAVSGQSSGGSDASPR
jgi:copper chaperone CopZ